MKLLSFFLSLSFLCHAHANLNPYLVDNHIYKTHKFSLIAFHEIRHALIKGLKECLLEDKSQLVLKALNKSKAFPTLQTSQKFCEAQLNRNIFSHLHELNKVRAYLGILNKHHSSMRKIWTNPDLKSHKQSTVQTLLKISNLSHIVEPVLLKKIQLPRLTPEEILFALDLIQLKKNQFCSYAPHDPDLNMSCKQAAKLNPIKSPIKLKFDAKFGIFWDNFKRGVTEDYFSILASHSIFMVMSDTEHPSEKALAALTKMESSAQKLLYRARNLDLNFPSPSWISSAHPTLYKYTEFFLKKQKDHTVFLERMSELKSLGDSAETINNFAALGGWIACAAFTKTSCPFFSIGFGVYNAGKELAHHKKLTDLHMAAMDKVIELDELKSTKTWIDIYSTIITLL